MLHARRQIFRLLALGGCLGAHAVRSQPIPHLMDLTDPAVIQKLWVVNDGVMGGVSQSRLVADADGVIFEGRVSLENNGGFASMRGPVAAPITATEFALRARGDGKRYKMIVRTDTSPRTPIYECDFQVATEWTLHRFRPADFKASFRGRAVDAPALVLSNIVEFGVLIADRQEGMFRIQLRRLEFA